MIIFILIAIVLYFFLLLIFNADTKRNIEIIIKQTEQQKILITEKQHDMEAASVLRRTYWERLAHISQEALAIQLCNEVPSSDLTKALPSSVWPRPFQVPELKELDKKRYLKKSALFRMLYFIHEKIGDESLNVAIMQAELDSELQTQMLSLIEKRNFLKANLRKNYSL